MGIVIGLFRFRCIVLAKKIIKTTFSCEYKLSILSRTDPIRWAVIGMYFRTSVFVAVSLASDVIATFL